jgi:hypothetical protein
MAIFGESDARRRDRFAGMDSKNCGGHALPERKLSQARRYSQDIHLYGGKTRSRIAVPFPIIGAEGGRHDLQCFGQTCIVAEDDHRNGRYRSRSNTRSISWVTICRRQIGRPFTSDATPKRLAFLTRQATAGSVPTCPEMQHGRFNAILIRIQGEYEGRDIDDRSCSGSDLQIITGYCHPA